MRRWALLAAAVFVSVTSASAQAASGTGIEILDKIGERSDTDPGLDVTQNRKYELLHEVSVLFGGLPADVYFKGITATGGYTLHFSDFVAWEVAQFTYSINLDSKLKKELQRIAVSLQSGEPEFPEINWILASHLILKPIYGKEALFNREVVHIEAFLQAGPAFMQRTTPATTFNIGVDTGVGFRLWWTEFASVRFDIGELIYWADGKPKQALHLHAGFGFNFRGEE